MASQRSKRLKEKPQLRSENRQLLKEIDDLEAALLLHQQLIERDRNSIQGLIRQEVGGPRWQHGSAGRLRTYKPNQELPSGGHDGRSVRAQSGRHPRLTTTSRTQQDPPKLPSRPSRMSSQNSSAVGRRPASGKKDPGRAPASGNHDDPILFSSTMEIGNLKDKIIQRVNSKVIQRPSPQVKNKGTPEGKSGDLKNTYTVDKKAPLNPSLDTRGGSDRKGKTQPPAASKGGDGQRRNSLNGIDGDPITGARSKPILKPPSQGSLSSQKNHKEVLNSQRDDLSRFQSQPENQRLNKSKVSQKQVGVSGGHSGSANLAGSKGDGHASQSKISGVRTRPASAKAPQPVVEAPRPKSLTRPQSAKSLPPKYPSLPAHSKAGQKNLKGTYLIQDTKPPEGRPAKGAPRVHHSLSSDEDEEIARACRGSGEVLNNSDSDLGEVPHPPAPKQPPPQFGGGHSSLFTGAGTMFEYNPNLRRSVLDQVEDILHPQSDADEDVATDRTQTTEREELLLQRKTLTMPATDSRMHERFSRSFTSSRKDPQETYLNEYFHHDRADLHRSAMADQSQLSGHHSYSTQQPKSMTAVPSLDFSEDAVQIFDEGVDDWLLGLDLRNGNKYRKIFAKHEIEKDDLKYLTKDQLQQMGVDAVGSLNKILKGIENLWLEDVKEKEKPKPEPPDFDPFSVGIWADARENTENKSKVGVKSKASAKNAANGAKSNCANTDGKMNTFTKLRMVSPDSPSENIGESSIDQRAPAGSQNKQSNRKHAVDSRTYTKHSDSSLQSFSHDKPPQPKAGYGAGRDGSQQGSKSSLSHRSGSGSDRGEDSEGRKGRDRASPAGSQLRSASAGRKAAGEEKPKPAGRAGARPNSAKKGLPRSDSYEAFARHPAPDKDSLDNQRVMEKHKQQRNKMAARHQDRERKKQEAPKDYNELCLAGEREQREEEGAETRATPFHSSKPPPAISGWSTTTPDFSERDPEIESLIAMTTHNRPLHHQLDATSNIRVQKSSDFQSRNGERRDFHNPTNSQKQSSVSGMSTQTSTNFRDAPRNEGIATQTSMHFSRGAREDSGTQMSTNFMNNEETGTQMSRNFMGSDGDIGTQTSVVFARRPEGVSEGTQMSVDYAQRRQSSQGATQTSTTFHRTTQDLAAGTQTSLDFSQHGRITNQTDLKQLIRSLKQQAGAGDRSSLELVRDLQQQLLSLETELLADSDAAQPPEQPTDLASLQDGSRDSSHSSDRASGSPADPRPISVTVETKRTGSASKGGPKPAKVNTVTFNLDLGDGSGLDEGSRPEGVKERQGGGRSGVASMSMSKRELLDSIRKEKDEHRKQVRHLQGELSRLQHRDPVRKSELDIRDISFRESDLVGEGAFSQVFRGTYQGAEVAIKQLKVPLSAQDKNYFAAEVSLLRELRHPRVVLLLGVCTSERLPLMVLEYLAKGNLFSLLHNPSREALDHVEYYQVARDMAAGLLYLHGHRPPILHLDLKSANVLIGSGHRAKIADFGFSKLKLNVDVKSSKSKENIQGSPAWMAPEMLQGGEVTLKADVYSFGVILWEMLTRKHPYEGCSVFQILERVRQKKRPEIPESCPAELSTFIQSCWDHNPARRPAFRDILPKLEHLTFPPEWRALFQAAGVPREALENIESTRNIISLVTSTLEASQLREMLEQMPDAPESQRSEAEALPDSQGSGRDAVSAAASQESSGERQTAADAGRDRESSVRLSGEENVLEDPLADEMQGSLLASAEREQTPPNSSPMLASGSSQISRSRGRGLKGGTSLTRSGASLLSGDLKMSDVVEEDEEEESGDEEEEEDSDEEIEEEIEKVTNDSDSFHLSESVSDDSLDEESTGRQSKSMPPQTVSTGEPVMSGRQSQRSTRSQNSHRSSREAWHADSVSVDTAPSASSTRNNARNETALMLTESLTGRLDSSIDNSSRRTPNQSARLRRSARQGDNSAPRRGKAPPPPPPPPLPEDGTPPPPPPLLITPMSLAPTRSHAEPRASGSSGLAIDPSELQAVGRGLQKPKAGVGRGGAGGRGRGAQGRGREGAQFSVDASQLVQQRQQLKPTAHPHPNQLQDLQSLNQETLASIAGLLKKAMGDRRFAMGETSISMDNTVHSDLTWSLQDD